MLEQYPELKLPPVAAEWKAVVADATSEETEAHGLGWQSLDVWRTEADFLLDKRIIKAPVDVTRIVDNQFVEEHGR